MAKYHRYIASILQNKYYKVKLSILYHINNSAVNKDTKEDMLYGLIKVWIFDDIDVIQSSLAI